MIQQAACFTGHRDYKPEFNLDYVMRKITSTVKELKNRDITDFIIGAALGFDTIAGIVMNDLKNEKGLDIRFHLMIPCTNQSEFWNDSQKTMYESLKKVADSVKYVHDGPYYDGCMLDRNKAMVDNSSVVVALWDGRRKGGTYQTIQYAKKQKKEIIYIERNEMHIT